MAQTINVFFQGLNEKFDYATFVVNSIFKIDETLTFHVYMHIENDDLVGIGVKCYDGEVNITEQMCRCLLPSEFNGLKLLIIHECKNYDNYPGRSYSRPIYYEIDLRDHIVTYRAGDGRYNFEDLIKTIVKDYNTHVLNVINIDEKDDEDDDIKEIYRDMREQLNIKQREFMEIINNLKKEKRLEFIQREKQKLQEEERLLLESMN